ncbi:MAG: 4Fe-4S binding protein [Verrucomicrobiota bacterium]|jgi:polyferredoxin
MNLVVLRRIAQIFFLTLFVWFCVVTTVGDRWWQLRGWPVNWLLQLDPLVALGTLLTTRTIYAGLLWALLTVALTILLGRFFCGWVCPFGACHQFIGWLGRRRKKHAERVAMNQYRAGQAVKYYLLIALLAAASGGLLAEILRWPREVPAAGLIVLAASLAATLWLATRKVVDGWKKTAEWFAALLLVGTALGFLVRPEVLAASSLQTGLLDPIPLMHRSVNLVILTAFNGLATASRLYVAAWSLAAVLFAALLLNLWIPRFYCRFICPLGALFGVLARWAPWRVGKRQGECAGCELCENNCEGACDPFGKIHPHECLLCMNCLRACRQAQMTYGPHRSAAGEIPSPGLTRRGFLTAAVSGLAAVPAVRLAGRLNQNWDPSVVRPPGALAEEDFLQRCLKCGQCMRACPTNVIQPATIEAGLEGLWTPILNFRVGTSGCQLNCIACGNVCPTAAIRPLSLDEKLGRGDFAERGPVRLGTAFLDRGRCLPWAMDKPCIVCQENCPVSPKAIYVREEFQVIRDGARTVVAATANGLTLDGTALPPGALGTGDYFVRLENAATGERRLIADNSAQDLKLAAPWTEPPAAGSRISIEVCLQKPFVDAARCTGCGICEHECPVSGLRAVRVSAENETRNQRHSLSART